MMMFFACKKEVIISAIPEIEFVSITPATVQEFTDEITIAIYYFDANGDLGENDSDVKNMFVKDNRNEIEYEYRIPELTPSGSNIAIQGNFDIKINGTGITDESSIQNVNYDIYVIDRDANKSNVITTSSITIQQ
jgi:hypothetical protein